MSPTTRSQVPKVGIPTPPPLPADLEALLRRLRMPHIRAHAPDVLATAKAQRWDPTEVLKVLLAEEVAGRDRSHRRLAFRHAAIEDFALRPDQARCDLAVAIRVGVRGGATRDRPPAPLPSGRR